MKEEGLADAGALVDRMEEALVDAEADLLVEMGGLRETAQARVWRNGVLVDWVPDETAGGCLLRSELVRRLLTLGARATVERGGGRGDRLLVLRAGARSVAALSTSHSGLAARLGRPPAIELRLRFDSADGSYTGGEEIYLVEPTRRRTDAAPLLRLTANVRPRRPAPTSASAPTPPVLGETPTATA